MHPIEIRRARLAFAIAALVCLLAAPALADDRPWEQPRWYALNARLFPSGEEVASGQRWLESQLHTTKRHAFEYSRSLRLGFERKFVFGIQGPLAEERAPGLVVERAPGLAFELRF